mgnify:CR=1 FL=1
MDRGDRCVGVYEGSDRARAPTHTLNRIEWNRGSRYKIEGLAVKGGVVTS